MATYTKFQPFVEALAKGLHNLGTDQLAVALTNTAPVNTYSQLSQITQISYTNLSSRNVTTTSSNQTGGVYKLVLQDLTLTGSGAVGPFRYIVLYNDTATNDDLIAYCDYGSSLSFVESGENLVINFDGTDGVIQIT